MAQTIDRHELARAVGEYFAGMAETPEGIDLLGRAGVHLFAPVFRMRVWDALDRFLAKAHHRLPPANQAVGLNAVKLVERDPARIQLLVANLGSVPVYLGDSSRVTTGGLQGAVATATQQANAEASGANAQQVATIGGAAGTLTAITGLEITGEGATAATTVVATLTGVQGGTISIPVAVPAGAGVPISPITVTFGPEGLVASAVGQAISLTLPAFGAGNTLQAVAIQGFTQTQLVAGSGNADPDGGWPVLAGTVQVFDRIATEVWAIASLAGQDVRVLDLSG